LPGRQAKFDNFGKIIKPPACEPLKAHGKEALEGLNLPVNKEKSGVSEVKGLNKYLQGWVAYFGIQEFKKLFGDFDTWMRMNKCQSVHRRTVRFLMNLNWFRKRGLIFLNHFTKRSLEQPLFSR